MPCKVYLPRTWPTDYLDVFAIVFAIYTQSANPIIIITDNAGMYYLQSRERTIREAKETLHASSDLQGERTIPPFAQGAVQLTPVPSVLPTHHIV
jgi:hypothetical protein